MKKTVAQRWFGEDYPGAAPRFQINLFAKDFSIFIVIPAFSVVFYKSCETALSSDKKPSIERFQMSSGGLSERKSQIIEFRSQSSGGSAYPGVMKKAPGTLVKVRLMNVVETYSNAPVHAQVVDAGLGRNLVGATLIGDATPDSNFNRFNIEFRFVRDFKRDGVAIPITARALSLDGTLGVNAKKKEGLFARASLNSAGGATQELQGKMGTDLNSLIAKALTAGLLQEFGSDSQVAKNRSQVLALRPLTEFYVELTDFFPGGGR